ncbi:MAG: UDP-N-acetylmuramoyl-tripeptide--D-alanyl-D-alanine ligase [Actinomycetota bacterium]|nr:UDP-N-acetylmuramoyl-tripeptide--D-alanyl-D-alanine ligase [Actinomycetota bacterium]
MIPLPVAELAGLGRLEANASEVTGVQIDSRRVRTGDLFVAIRGGVDYVEEARRAGAAATLIPDDDFAAMAAIGRAVRSRSRAEVVGITGSTGKTSTKDILAALCRPHRLTVAAEASFNAELGVPLTLARLEAETELLICELAMRGFGQIAELCAIARPTLGAITAIGPVHLEFVGSIEGVAKAKAELLDALPERATAVIPARVPELETYVRDDLAVLRVGEDTRLLSFDDGRLEADVLGERVELELPLKAPYQAHNALVALTVYAALGLPLDRVHEGAREIELSRLRGEELRLAGGGVLINDCWNANPASMAAALQQLATRSNGGRRVAVLGGMAELGAETERYHRQIGELLAQQEIDVVIAVGELARAYGAGEWVRDAEEAAARLSELLQPGDVVLVKGSRSVGLEAVAENLPR